MAECPYARCIQERRHIRRELLRWTKNMVFVVGLERVAEELMGRRRWKQYQDTLYSSTRSESANQPHHRLYPGTALTSSCNVVTVGGGGGVGVGGGGGSLGQVVAQRPSSGIGEIALVQGATAIDVASTLESLTGGVANTTTTTITTTTPTTTTTTACLSTSACATTGSCADTDANACTTIAFLHDSSTASKTTRLQQRNSLHSSSNHRGNASDDERGHVANEGLDVQPRLRPESIKLEIEDCDGLQQREAHGTCVVPRRNSSSSSNNNNNNNNNNNAQTQEHTGQRGRFIKEEGRDIGENENGEREDVDDTETESEKRLKSVEDQSRQTGGQAVTRQSAVSPLRENETRRSSREQETGTNDLADTIGNKQTEERIEAPTTGLLRVKKEEELQEVPRSVSCGVDASTISRLGNIVDPTNSDVYKVTEQAADASLPYLVNRRASPPPEDWKPLDKCFFCLDGKLPHDEQPPLSPQSESSSSSRSAESPMSVQVDPMAASVVAAALSGTYPTLLPQWCLPPRESPLVGVQSHQDGSSGVDQPLDLSAKPKNSQDNHVTMAKQQKIPLRMPTGIDPKSIFTSSYRAKPRMTGPVGVGGVPVVGAGGSRRSYTEEELQAALRDIQSGKLGTRRAAVIYGIPRSTLRNKVYKLALERERDATLNSTHSHPLEPGAQASTTTMTTTTSTTTTTTTSTTISTTRTTSTTTPSPNTIQNASATTPPPQVDEVEDKDLSGAEEEKEVEKALLRPLLSLEDLVRFSALEGSGSDSLRTLLQRGQETGTEWPGFEHANIGPYIQKMLAAARPFKGLETPDYRIPEVMRRLMSEDKRLNKDVNGDHLQQQQQLHQHHLHHSHHHQSQQQQQPQHQHHHHHHQSSHQQTVQQLSHQSQQSSQQHPHRGPITNDDFNPSIEEEASDSGQGRAILKIPSYKPASSTPGSSKNNGEPNSAAFAQSFAAAATASSAAGSPGLLERASPAFSGTSSPTNSLVGKGVGVNFRDVIAKSISVKFQEGQAGLGGQGSMVHSPTAMMTEPNPFKRGRYTPPQTSQSQQPKPQSQQDKSKPNAGGKGTRPKRGKYRNYDRDSLVEAVRAVQRGEMSVHRAGSFYGVPHSTLEYKVKERHLMRPRKRDQKQPEDKSKESPGAAGPMRSSLGEKKPQLKPQKPFAASPGGMPGGPNGLKMPPFLEGMAPLPFPHPFNFWGPTPFMPSPFMAGGPNVPTILPEQYFATQRMRGLQEQQRSAIVQQQAQRERDGLAGGASEAGTSNSRGSSMVKSTREIAESLYDGTGANGSFLDNLIRSSLETGIPRDQRAMAEARGSQQQQQQQQQQSSATVPQQRERERDQRDHLPEAMSSRALIDQLCRNSRRTPLPRVTHDSSEDESYRGPSSGRSLPDRPERVPTVDLSQSPTDRTRMDDQCNDRLNSPPTPMSITRTGSRDEDNTRESMRLHDRGSGEREIHNGGQQQDDREHRKTLGSIQSQQINHYSEMHSLYAVSNDKKSACDSKLIVDHSSQHKTQQQHKDLGTLGGLVVQLQRGYNTGSTSGRGTTTTTTATTTMTSSTTTPTTPPPSTTSASPMNEQTTIVPNNTLANAIGQSNTGLQEQRASDVHAMEESIEQ